MKHPRFEITSEQTLHLAELRDALAKALPDDVAESVKFPVASYNICVDCSGSCLGTCYVSCSANCKGACTTTCTNFCRNSCIQYCNGNCVSYCPGNSQNG
jgi:hypothetical protein